MHQLNFLIPHPFLILPSEIIGRLLTEINPNTLDTIQMLALVSTKFNLCVRMSIRYVSRLIARESSILPLFEGVKHLTILECLENNNFHHVRLTNFSKSIWRKLESMKISVSIAREYGEMLESEYCLDDVQDLTNIGLKDVQDLTKDCLRDNTMLNNANKEYFQYIMPNLRSLSIQSEDYSEDNELCLDSRFIPSLNILNLHGCQILNIDHFVNLDILKISYQIINKNTLSRLRISGLYLENTKCTEPLNISSLRKLSIVEGFLNIEHSTFSNLSELVVRNLNSDTPQNIYIPSLRKLIYQDNNGKALRISGQHLPNLEELRLISVNENNNVSLDFPILKKLMLVDMNDVKIIRLKNLESLILNDSTLYGRIYMIKLRSLDIMNPRSINPNTFINMSSAIDLRFYPNLRFLNVYGFDGQGKNNLVISRNPSPTLYRYEIVDYLQYGCWNKRIRNSYSSELLEYLFG